MPHSLLVIGSLKTSWAKDGCTQYRKRLSIDVVELPASKQKDPGKQRDEESASILKKLEKQQGQVWVLDERGEAMTSKDFSKALESLRDLGDAVTFILGGAYGLSDEVKDRADRLFRLSDMTLPHELCQIVFLEQLYRAGQIQKGTGYHH